MPARRQRDSTFDLEAIVAEITSLQADRAGTEGAGPPLAQRQADAEAALNVLSSNSSGMVLPISA
jgi:hypothetical protein